eukprot:scaffold16444_cov29-Tisochrysis_lutea.AAC.5
MNFRTCSGCADQASRCSRDQIVAARRKTARIPAQVAARTTSKRASANLIARAIRRSVERLWTSIESL